MRTILAAVDGTKKGLEMVSVLGRLLKERDDVKLVLLHCVPKVATLLPEDLYMDVEGSNKYGTQEKLGQAVLKAASEKLTEAGFPESNIELRCKIDSVDPAADILEQAQSERIATIAVGRRGRSQVETLLLGGVSAKVAQYAGETAVWVVDVPAYDSMNVLIAMEGTPESRALSEYAADFFAPGRSMSYSFMHIIPSLPPEFWDDGHILNETEQKQRQALIEKWRVEWTGAVERSMGEGRKLLLERGVDPQKVETLVLPTREGIVRDLLAEIEAHRFQVVVLGKRSFRGKKPFLLGSHASKILNNSRGAIVCLVN
ncbi:MAG: universal stress protein [Syntrophobacteraceae bacterium]